MKAYVVSKVPGAEEVELWTGTLEGSPRPDEFLSVNPDDASYLVDRVEWDCSGPRAELKVFVK